MTREIIAVVASLICSTASTASGQADTGALAGIVVDEGGRPQSGARLSCQKQTEYTKDERGRSE